MSELGVRRRLGVVGLGVLVLVATLLTGPGEVTAQGNPIVTGGGASFPGLELQQWRADVAGPPYGLSVNYTSAGSTFGREQYMAGTLDFGVSDIRFQPEEQGRLQASPRRSFVYVPISAGALAFMYNVVGTDGRRITDLKLTQEDVCRLFTEPDITWNDPSIASYNPGVPLPPSRVRPVLRSDGSGTSYVFSEFCLATARNTWFRFVGDPDDPKQLADLEARSPINRVDQIRAPLLVIQGANDPRVTKQESDQIVDALRERGVPVEYMVKDDEGHGFVKPENRMDMYRLVERFLADHLGGRLIETA